LQACKNKVTHTPESLTICLDDLMDVVGVVPNKVVEGYVSRCCRYSGFVGDLVHGTPKACIRRLALTRVTDVLCVEAMRSQKTETDFAFRQLQASLADFDPLRPDPAVGAH